MNKPLAIDLFTGLHGWAEGLIAEGWEVIGFDLEDMCAQFSEPRPKHMQLVLQDVSTLHGSQFKDADLIVASPPCQAYSYRAMPFSRAKGLPPPDNTLFEACFRIQREACEAAGRHIPLIVENVKGAQKWVGRSRWNFGSYHLWGDVPALMPIPVKREAVKNPGQNWSNYKADGVVSPHWNVSGIKQHGSGAEWFDKGIASFSSKSKSRKRASAMIAKIPLTLSQHIARVFYPETEAA